MSRAASTPPPPTPTLSPVPSPLRAGGERPADLCPRRGVPAEWERTRRLTHVGKCQHIISPSFVPARLSCAGLNLQGTSVGVMLARHERGEGGLERERERKKNPTRIDHFYHALLRTKRVSLPTYFLSDLEGPCIVAQGEREGGERGGRERERVWGETPVGFSIHLEIPLGGLRLNLSHKGCCEGKTGWESGTAPSLEGTGQKCPPNCLALELT